MRKIVIVHDNRKNALLLQDYLAATPGVSVTGVFPGLAEAGSALHESRCDVVIAGLTVLEKLAKEESKPAIWVCLGAEPAAAPAALHRNIFAYLDNSFSYERVFSLLQTIGHYMTQQTYPAGPAREYIFIKSEYKLIRINLSDILFLSGLRDYTQVFLKGKVSPLTTLQNLKDFENKLPESAFVRVHRSYIVSLGQVDTISRNEITIGTYTIPIGHAYRQLLDEMIQKNS